MKNVYKNTPFNWADPFLLDDRLKEEERQIFDPAADFSTDKLAPRVEAAYLNELTDPEEFREMGEAGLLGGEWEKRGGKDIQVIECFFGKGTR